MSLPFPLPLMFLLPNIPNLMVSLQSCRAKEAVLSVEHNQVINLTTAFRYSGCRERLAYDYEYRNSPSNTAQLNMNNSLVNMTTMTTTNPEKGRIIIECRSNRTFASTRERWWFIAISNCDSKKGLRLKYRITMTNDQSPGSWIKHFSADQLCKFSEESPRLLYTICSEFNLSHSKCLEEDEVFHLFRIKCANPFPPKRTTYLITSFLHLLSHCHFAVPPSWTKRWTLNSGRHYQMFYTLTLPFVFFITSFSWHHRTLQVRHLYLPDFRILFRSMDFGDMVLSLTTQLILISSDSFILSLSHCFTLMRCPPCPPSPTRDIQIVFGFGSLASFWTNITDNILLYLCSVWHGQ